MADTAIWCNIHNRSDVDSCQECDQDNPEYMRPMTVYVAVDRNWLTDDGEYTDTDGGWKYLEGEICKKLTIRGLSPEVVITCDGWAGEPEIVGKRLGR